MKIGIFEKIFLKKLKNTKNKSIIELCINNEQDLFNKYTIFNGKDMENNNVRINNDLIEYLKNEIKNIPSKNALMIKIRNGTIYDVKFIEELIKN